VGSSREIEETMCRRDQALAEERSADLEHQLMIVLKAQLEDPLD
jgi:hypothetical protein